VFSLEGDEAENPTATVSGTLLINIFMLMYYLIRVPHILL